MEDLQLQLDKTRSDLVIACARLRGTEVLARNVEDLRRENDVLREQLMRYEDALLSVENRLESFASLHGSDGVPSVEVQRPVAVSSLLEENQRLNSIIEMMQRERMPGQDSSRFMNMGEERAALEERIEELQSENDILREEVELARSVAQTNRSGDGDLDTASITERLERSERAVVTKSHLVELLSSEVQRLDFELRSAREELAQQCGGEGCQHQREAEQVKQVVVELGNRLENLNNQRQEESQRFVQFREELERQVAEKQNMMQASMEKQKRVLEERAEMEKKEMAAKLQHSQTIVARLNDDNQQLRKNSNTNTVHLKQAQLKLQQVTHDRDRQKEYAKSLEQKNEDLNSQLTKAMDDLTDARRQMRRMGEPTVQLATSRNIVPAEPPLHARSGLIPRGHPSAVAVSDGLDKTTQPVVPIKFVKPDSSRPQPQQMQVQGVERECPICHQRFTMELTAFYAHCDQCAESQG